MLYNVRAVRILRSVSEVTMTAKKRSLIIVLIMCLLCMVFFCACSIGDKKTPLKVIIIPKLEVNEITGDFPGEAQLFYENYCADCEEAEIPHMPSTARFFVNEENGVGILLTGSGKAAAGLSLTALLSSELYDYSDAYIVSVGCAGGNMSHCTLGDVILVTTACDYDLGHHVDAHEKEKSNSRIMWFADDAYSDYEFKSFDTDLCDKVYGMIKDVPLKTTKAAKEMLKDNYPSLDESDLTPSVKKGTSLTGDNYWKGLYSHDTANYIAEYYGCPEPYTVTEMEEIAIANTAECYGLLDRVISMRVIVNTDLFMEGETPEETWGEYKSFNEKVETENNETLDIFEPAMHNLYDTASKVIDAILEGKM